MSMAIFSEAFLLVLGLRFKNLHRRRRALPSEAPEQPAERPF